MIGKNVLHYRFLKRLGEGGMPSLNKKYTKLVPRNGRRR